MDDIFDQKVIANCYARCRRRVLFSTRVVVNVVINGKTDNPFSVKTYLTYF